jgi:hypothetical protein
VPPNPLEGLTYDSAYIRDFLDTISGPIVLVGHHWTAGQRGAGNLHG